MKRYTQYLQPKQIAKPDMEWLEREELAKIISEELGISMAKSVRVFQIMITVFETALTSGKAVRLGSNIVLEPVTVTEAVGGVQGYSAIFKVVPEHTEYRVRLSQALQDKIYGDTTPFYVLNGTGKPLTWEQCLKFPDAYKIRNFNRKNRKGSHNG